MGQIPTMTAVIILGIAAITAFTTLTAVALVMQAKERMHTRRQDDYVALQREAMAANRASIRDALRRDLDG